LVIQVQKLIMRKVPAEHLWIVVDQIIDSVTVSKERVPIGDLKGVVTSSGYGFNELKEFWDLYGMESLMRDSYLAIEGQDPVIVEAYSYLTDRQKKILYDTVERIYKTIKELIESLTPIRVRKQREKKVNLDKVMIDPKSPLGPERVIGSNSVIVFDLKYNKIKVLYAGNNQKLTISGTTIKNYDEERSFSKRIRPNHQPKIYNKTFKTLEKFIVDFSSKVSPTDGRLNNHCIILAIN